VALDARARVATAARVVTGWLLYPDVINDAEKLAVVLLLDRAGRDLERVA